MTQVWDPELYNQNAAFVPGLAGGVLEWLNAQPGEKILDLGCGDGQLTSRLVSTGARVRGFDASAEMAAAARTRGIEVDEGSAEKLPYPDAAFDAVFSNAALHWMREQDAVLAEVHRVLKRGGRFVAEMGGHGNIAAIRVALAAVLDRNGYDGRSNDANYYPSDGEYSRRLEDRGFHLKQIALIPRPTPLPESGMAGWIRTFRRGVLDTLPESIREKIVHETVELLAPALRDPAGNWTADYVRLRFIAIAQK
ncbi:MAG TPA: methyltransferase domain-containing protein [Terracidiphilus sp.]|nr:methyltransferase domain-containing protein [Terracidiphilus sp.]